jgi:hypothetical protein
MLNNLVISASKSPVCAHFFGDLYYTHTVKKGRCMQKKILTAPLADFQTLRFPLLYPCRRPLQRKSTLYSYRYIIVPLFSEHADDYAQMHIYSLLCGGNDLVM